MDSESVEHVYKKLQRWMDLLDYCDASISTLKIEISKDMHTLHVWSNWNEEAEPYALDQEDLPF